MLQTHAASLTRYGLVGALNTVSDLVLFSVFHYGLGIPPVPANVTSYGIAIGQSFVLNRRFTFRAASGGRASGTQFARFLAVCLLCLVISTVLVALLAAPVGAFGAKLLATGVSFVLGYWLNRRFVFSARV